MADRGVNFSGTRGNEQKQPNEGGDSERGSHGTSWEMQEAASDHIQSKGPRLHLRSEAASGSADVSFATQHYWNEEKQQGSSCGLGRDVVADQVDRAEVGVGQIFDRRGG